MSLEDLKEDYDWKHIFENYADATHVKTKETHTFTLNDVVNVLAFENGENDGDNWVGLFIVKYDDNHKLAFLAIRAGCDYTGWGCQESGNSDWADTLPDAIAFALTEEERTRLNAKILV